MSTIDYFAPGRVNLIGEHIDYNGGLVMPIALNMGIKARYKKNDNNTISFASSTHKDLVEFAVEDIPTKYESTSNWCNYPIGVLSTLHKQGLPINGFDLHFDSNLPEGSGLSSSAAIEVVTAYILMHQAGREINPPDLAVLCQKVENNFIGVKCGIMDQFAVANGKKDHAILLNCNTLDCEQIPFDLDTYSLLVINSKKPRSLIKSAYNERKAESEAALKILIDVGKLRDGQYLVDAEIEDLGVIADAIVRKRTRHVVSENIRVKHATRALKMGDLYTFGRLMNASHQSLKDDYEVSGIELDTLVETAQNIDGCIGARMTGAGFGGCAIALVKNTGISNFSKTLADRYHAVTKLHCEIYECKAEDGVRLLD